MEFDTCAKLTVDLFADFFCATCTISKCHEAPRALSVTSDYFVHIARKSTDSGRRRRRILFGCKTVSHTMSVTLWQATRQRGRKTHLFIQAECTHSIVSSTVYRHAITCNPVIPDPNYNSKLSYSSTVTVQSATLQVRVGHGFETGALKLRDLTTRDLTTRHQIKQIATDWTSIGPRKNWTCWTNDKRIKSCLSRFYSGAYSRLLFLYAVSHSLSAHTESLQPQVDNRSNSNSSEDEDNKRHGARGRRNRQRQPQQRPRTTVTKCAS